LALILLAARQEKTKLYGKFSKDLFFTQHLTENRMEELWELHLSPQRFWSAFSRRKQIMGFGDLLSTKIKTWLTFELRAP
jgi:hypothetical protein